MCRPSIKVSFKANLLALIESFPTVHGTPPARKEIMAIPNF